MAKKTQQSDNQQPATLKSSRAPQEGSLIQRIVADAWAEPKRGVPCLIGPTRGGKTHFALAALAAAGIPNDRVAMVNPANDLPEDMAGYPVREGKRLVFTQPSLIPPHFLEDGKPWGLFIDEVDKARDDSLSSLLTLLNPAERRLRYTHIPPSVPIIAAMNEPERELPAPLIGRMLFLGWPPADFDWSRVPEMARVAHFTGYPPKPEVRFPVMPDSAGARITLSHWLGAESFMDGRELIVRGLFGQKHVPEILSRMEQDLVRMDLKTWAEKVKPSSVLADLETLLLTWAKDGKAFDKNDFLGALSKLAERAEADKTSELAAVMGKVQNNLAQVLRCVGRPEMVPKLVETWKA